MARRLVISCPNCGAPNAATVAACVQCGAHLKLEATAENALAPTAGVNDVHSNAASYQHSDQTAATSTPQRNVRVQTPRSLAGNHKVGSKGSIAGLGAQAVFYVGCAILIMLPILLIGLGPLRIMLARIFQH